MSTLWIVVLMVAAPPPEPSMSGEPPRPPATAAQQAKQEVLTGVDLRSAVRAALRRWTRTSDRDARKAAGEFLVLFHALHQDHKMARSQREQYITKVRGRLLKLSRQIRKHAATERRLAGSKRPRSVEAVGKLNVVLAQQFGGLGGGGFGGGGFGGGMMGGPMMGGPMMGRPMMGGGGQVGDYGEKFVELIQSTVAPGSWDVNGGPGTIVYWRSRRVLVVRQMDDVHDDIVDLIEQLNRANR